MNIFQKIKAAWAAKSTVEVIVKEAKMETASGKPGWKTTEFWMSAATQIGVLWGAVQGFVPPKYAAIVSIIGAAVYTVARTVTKAVSDVQAAKVASPTAAVAETATATASVSTK